MFAESSFREIPGGQTRTLGFPRESGVFSDPLGSRALHSVGAHLFAEMAISGYSSPLRVKLLTQGGGR